MSLQEKLNNFKYIEGGRNLPNGGFARNEMLEISQVKDYRRQHKNTGLYLSAYIYDSLDVKEANLYADFYLDFDSEDDFELARQDALMSIRHMNSKFSYNIPIELFHIYFSGKKGIHIVVNAKVFGVEPDKNLNEYYKHMARSIKAHNPNDTLDMKIYDRRRLFRMTNSKHADTGLYKIPLTFKELVELPHEDILQLARMPRKVNYEPSKQIKRANAEYLMHQVKWEQEIGYKFNSKKKFERKPLTFVPHCIKNILEEGPIKGQRNETAACLTSYFKRQNKSEEETYNELVKWADGGMDLNELRKTMSSVYNSDYEYGCSKLEEVSECLGAECPLHKDYKRKPNKR